MGDIADDHFAELRWAGLIHSDDDGNPLVPPYEGAGGMDLLIAQRTESQVAPPAHPENIRAWLPDFNRPDYYDLVAAIKEGRVNPCPNCGAKADAIEYPLGICCSRGSCMPMKHPIYISDKLAEANGFASVADLWNAARLTPERDALIWTSPADALAKAKAAGLTEADLAALWGKGLTQN